MIALQWTLVRGAGGGVGRTATIPLDGGPGLWTLILAGIWLAGAAGCAARLAGAWRAAKQLERTAMPIALPAVTRLAAALDLRL